MNDKIDLKTIDPLEFGNKLIVITGAKGTGKTTAADTLNPPSKFNRVYKIDSELSSNNFKGWIEAQGYKYGRYLDMQARFSDLPGDADLLSRLESGNLPWVDKKVKSGLMEYYQYIVKDLDKNLEKGKFDVLVIDTIEKFEAGMAAWVDKNKANSGVTTTSFGRLWTDGVFPLYEQFMASVYGRGVHTIVLVSHLKTPWENNKPVIGKVKPAGKKILYFMSTLMVWLVNDSRNTNGEPAGLIMKERLAKYGINPNEDSWEIRKQLPPRIPTFTWDNVRKYLRNGCDFNNLKNTEIVSEEEIAMISDMVSDRQMELMLVEAKKELAEAKQQDRPMIVPVADETNDDGTVMDQIVPVVVEAISNDVKTAPKIKEYILEKIGVEVTMKQVIEAKKRL